MLTKSAEAERSLMRIFQVLFVNIFCMLVIIGCASVRKQRGFNDVQNIVESRTGLDVYWNQGTPEGKI